jgi:polar amino acid transport system substrate-binding protein
MIANPADLKGKTIGVQTATIHADYAQKYFKDSTVKVYDTADNHNADLVAGRIDYALLDSVAADDFAKANAAKGIEAKLVVPGDPIFGVGAGAGLRKGDAKLKDKLNAAIKAVRASGEYDTIAKKYFNFNIYGE